MTFITLALHPETILDIERTTIWSLQIQGNSKVDLQTIKAIGQPQTSWPWLLLGSLKIIRNWTGLWLRTSVTMVNDGDDDDDGWRQQVQDHHDDAQDAALPDTQSVAALQPESSAPSSSSLASFLWSLEGLHHPHPPRYCHHFPRYPVKVKVKRIESLIFLIMACRSIWDHLWGC